MRGKSINTHIIYFISPGGSDYFATTQDITFNSGQGVGSQVDISIPIINNNVTESIESFFGKLSQVSISESIILNPNFTEVIITDDDRKYL